MRATTPAANRYVCSLSARGAHPASAVGGADPLW